MRAFLILIITSLLLASCGSGHKTTTAARNLDSIPFYYVQLKGTMGKHAITLQLVRSSPNVYRGYYTIDSAMAPTIFWGAPDDRGRLILTESADYNEERFFTGEIDSVGNYKGIWRGRGTSYHFNLHPDMKDATALDVFYAADSTLANNGQRDTINNPILGEASNSMLWPAASLDTATANFIRTSITGNSAITDPGKYVKRDLDSFLQTYRVASVDFDTVVAMPNTSHWSADADMKVVYNHYPLLVLESFSYEYTGGAHGNYATIYQVLDLKRHKILTPEDVLKTGYKTALEPALEKEFRRMFKIDDDKDLADILFQPHITPNNNFLLTDKGIAFSYTPYEIGPYAMGQVTLFVPFKNIKQYVK